MKSIRFVFSSVLLTILMVLSGCGSNPVPTEAVTAAPPSPVKSVLDEVAKSGELGSAASTIRDGLEALKATDSAMAEALLGELTELEGLSDSAKIKEKAKEMAGKL